jgi:3-methyl-2-oxobutanoate hydroxymethyltransferase
MTRSINKINDLFNNKQKITAITSYTSNIASICDDFCDIILIGDSMEMVIYGQNDTTSLSLDCIIRHARAVSSSVKNAFVVCDVPFGYYEKGHEYAFESISQIIKQTGVDGVKIEGGSEYSKTIEFLTQRGIVVMGHIGLMPQRVRSHGSYKKITNPKEDLLKNAITLQNAGVFSIVLENCDENSAQYITQNLSIPTIGIGSGRFCSGQIAVLEDICGLSLKQPPFVKKYANLSNEIRKVLESYCEDVKIS